MKIRKKNCNTIIPVKKTDWKCLTGGINKKEKRKNRQKKNKK